MTDDERTAQIAMLEIRAAKLRALFRRDFPTVDISKHCTQCPAVNTQNLICGRADKIPYCDIMQQLRNTEMDIFVLENPDPLIF